MSETLTIGARSESGTGDYLLPEEGEYIGEFLGWTEPMQSKFINKKTGEFPWVIALRYRLTDFDDDPDYEIRTKLFDPDYTRDRTLEENLKALLQRERDDDEPVELSDLIGRKVRLFVEHVTKPGTNGDPMTYANISKVLSGKKRQPKKVVEDDDEFPE